MLIKKAIIKALDYCAECCTGYVNNNPVNIYLLKFNNRSTRKRYEKCQKLTIKTPERRSGVFIVNFGHISYLFPVLLLLTLYK